VIYHLVDGDPTDLPKRRSGGSLIINESTGFSTIERISRNLYENCSLIWLSVK